MSTGRSHARNRRGQFLQAAGPWISWAMRRSAERFIDRTPHYAASSRATLDRILALNGSTEFGRRCGLNRGTRRRVFEKLPVTTYADYARYVERTAAGELNVLSSEPVVYFSTTSGTTGPPKMIPVTARQMRMAVATRFTSMGLALRAGVLHPMRGRFMTIMTEHFTGRTDGGLPRGAATTRGFQQLGNISEHILTSPGEVLAVHDQASSRYLHLLFGLREERLWTMVAFFPATILFAMRALKANADRLLRDLADGTLDSELVLAPDLRASLLGRLRPDRARARALTALLDRDEFTLPNIWPDLGAVLTATGGAFRFYTEQLKPHLGNVAVFSPVYSASEGTMGFGFSADQPNYLMLPTLAYVELLPEEAMDDPLARPIPAWEAQPGASYEVVITTLAGFTRYRLHDIVRVLDFQGQTPVFEFIERRGQVIDIVGEKTAEHHIAAAIEDACHAVEAPLVDYFVVPNTAHAPGHYVLVIESLGATNEHPRNLQTFLGAVETALRKSSPDYDEERELGSLAGMGMLLLKTGAFERYRARRAGEGVSESQLKIPHVVPDPGFIARQFNDEVLARIEEPL